MENNEELSKKIIDIPNGNASSDEYAESRFQEDNPENSSPVIIETGLMPEIKGLELLKKAGSTLKVGRTIKDMFSVIKNMESQLKKVLSINASLEKDLRDTKDVISDLKDEKVRLENEIADLEEELPSKRELQSRIDHLIEERNSAQPQIRDMRIQVDDMKKEVSKYRERLEELNEEKSDLLLEISFLEERHKAALKKIAAYERESHTLKGERLINSRKMKALEKDMKKCIFEKGMLAAELEDAKTAVHRIEAGLSAEGEVENDLQ
ncbi:MAG: hypothetical protein AMK71_09800 [Nitrospira bacterium SG8_35_4]|nr:MAG: hypothetical protein AMK71_09800 [Nitrospira bacterium SG8_35_4]